MFAELLDNPGETYAEVLRTRSAAGHWELIEYTAVNRLDDPLVDSIVITTRNVTDFTQAEAMLADEAKILELIARGAPLQQTLETHRHDGRLPHRWRQRRLPTRPRVRRQPPDGMRRTVDARPSSSTAAREAVIEPGDEPILGRAGLPSAATSARVPAVRTSISCSGRRLPRRLVGSGIRHPRRASGRHDRGALRRAAAYLRCASARSSAWPATSRPSRSNAIARNATSSTRPDTIT